MGMQKADIWRFLLFALALLAVHYTVLWRHWNNETLRQRLLVLEWDLSQLVRSHPAESGSDGVIQLQWLVRRLAESSQDLVYSRILFARILLQPTRSCRDALGDTEATLLRVHALEILDRVERAVALKLVTGSPVLWMYAAYRTISGTMGKTSINWVPGYQWLEVSLGGRSV